ncbi:MAG: septum formation initiator family protein [Acidiferrobacterales bacterium]
MQNVADQEKPTRFRIPFTRLVLQSGVHLSQVRSRQGAAKIAAFALTGLLLLLQYTLWFGTGGAVSLWRLQRQIAAQQAQDARMNERDLALAAKVLDLRQGLASVQDLARSQLGMIKKDETFYQVIQQPGRDSRSAQH